MINDLLLYLVVNYCLLILLLRSIIATSWKVYSNGVCLYERPHKIGIASLMVTTRTDALVFIRFTLLKILDENFKGYTVRIIFIFSVFRWIEHFRCIMNMTPKVWTASIQIY